MKRIGHLFEQAFTPENLHAAYEDARKGKRSGRACYQFERRLGAQLANLHATLHDGSYAPQPYHQFWVTEPKPRLIQAPAFRDRVVQHAIYRVIQPIFDATFIDQSFACRPGKGTHAAADYTQAAMQAAPAGSYFLQLDVRKFYYSIDRVILRSLLERHIKDARLLDVMMMFAQSGTEKGIPIGNLLSQLYGLIYLNPLDHFCKRQLKAERYCRYVDDFLIVGVSREEALAHKAAIIEFLRDKLSLSLSKSTIAPVSRGINFVGYRTWRTRRFVRKHSLYTFRRAAKRGRLESVISSLGHARKTGSHRHMINHLQEHHHGIYRLLPQSTHRAHRHHACLATPQWSPARH